VKPSVRVSGTSKNSGPLAGVGRPRWRRAQEALLSGRRLRVFQNEDQKTFRTRIRKLSERRQLSARVPVKGYLTTRCGSTWPFSGE
jgi:hypothetical protein